MNVKKTRYIYILWFLIFIVWTIYRMKGTFPEWVDEIGIKPGVFVLPVFAWVLLKERRTLSSIGLTLKNFFHEIYLGLGIGALFGAEGVVVNFIKYGTFSFVPTLAIASFGIFPFLIYSLSTAFAEEVLGRGFIYGRLYEANKNQLKSALIASFLFLLLHIPILFTQLNLAGPSLLVYVLSVFLLGITNCYLYGVRKSLVVPILIHIFWNATVALYL